MMLVRLWARVSWISPRARRSRSAEMPASWESRATRSLLRRSSSMSRARSWLCRDIRLIQTPSSTDSARLSNAMGSTPHTLAPGSSPLTHTIATGNRLATASRLTAQLIGSVMSNIGASANNAKKPTKPKIVGTQNSSTTPIPNTRFRRLPVRPIIARRPNAAYHGTISVSAPIAIARCPVDRSEMNSNTEVTR
ncbi:hypothetical protein [[Actinomadura] parvosata]|uniref:hypothetical protein n=1 Tax=[Actinomadura] parvosata TaxID=1955412 RepID=UPI001E286D32|nr:hypothetical protein [Nonomuraea sp. ATCC 55076]